MNELIGLAGALAGLALASPAGAAAITTPQAGTYEGTLFVTATSGTCTASGDPAVGQFGTSRLNYPASGNLDFSFLSGKDAQAFSLPLTASGSATLTEISASAAPILTSLSYSGMAVTVLDSATDVFRFAISVTEIDGCIVTEEGTYAPVPSAI
jgi:hypothetical protein